MDQRVINGHLTQPQWPTGGAPFGEEPRACEVCGAVCQPAQALCTWCAQLAMAAVEDL